MKWKPVSWNIVLKKRINAFLKTIYISGIRSSFAEAFKLNTDLRSNGSVSISNYTKLIFKPSSCRELINDSKQVVTMSRNLARQISRDLHLDCFAMVLTAGFYCDSRAHNVRKVRVFKSGREGLGRWGLLPIHSLKWNPNDVLTTCKAISKGLASRFGYWSSALRQNP